MREPESSAPRDTSGTSRLVYALLAGPGIMLWLLGLLDRLGAPLSPLGVSIRSVAVLALFGSLFVLTMTAARLLERAAASSASAGARAAFLTSQPASSPSIPSAERRRHSLADVSSNVAHRINNELMAIHGCLELAQKHGIEPRLQPHFTAARSAVRNIHIHLDHMAAFSHDGPPARTFVELHRSIPFVERRLLEVDANSKLIWSLEPDLPVVEVDPDQLDAAIFAIVRCIARSAAFAAPVWLRAGTVSTGPNASIADGSIRRWVVLRFASTDVSSWQPVMPPEPLGTDQTLHRGLDPELALAQAFAEEHAASLRIDTAIDLYIPGT